MVEHGARFLAAARADAVAVLRNDRACAICDDRYPAGHLLAPRGEGVTVYPACAFDEDLGGADTAQLTFFVDRLLHDDLAAPAGWSAIIAFLACARPGLGDQLEQWWHDRGTLYVPLGYWNDPGKI
ncbi:hypothetical protein J4573_16280 [Actinomadura barringtoniae]|uniref:Uncharacterized protein n=1 Tax=Actinomadura barringtoniae TaxID=1427535 RepID=A0A939TA42_9ACTN|nr:hypothetical protein [Actinomadura barringtoniae]MBO2448660.1 hypothetical protein [Actinomadura barringtoniae]